MTKITWRRLAKTERIAEGDYWASFDMNNPSFIRWVDRAGTRGDRRQYIELACAPHIGMRAEVSVDGLREAGWDWWRPVSIQTDEVPEVKPVNQDRKIEMEL